MFPNDYYNNMEIPGEAELTSYLPKYWRDILEMQANNAFAGYTLDRAGADIDQLVKDRFFDTCSVDKLCDYERFLNIYNTKGMSVEDRRTQVKMRWNGDGKMTGARIKAIVKECCGSDCEVTFGSSQLVIDMVFRDNPSKYMTMIRETISNSTIPAHIEIVFKGSADLRIIISLKNEVEVPEIAMGMDLSMNHAGHYFDGSLKWDGSHKFNSSYNWFVFGSAISLEFKIKERFQFFVSVNSGIPATLSENIVNKGGIVMSCSIVTNIAKGKMVRVRAGMLDRLPKIRGMAFGDGAKQGTDYRIPQPTDISLQNELLRQEIDAEKTELCSDGISVLYKCTLDKGVLGGKNINELALYDEDGDLVAIKSFSDKGKDDDMEMIFTCLDKYSDGD